MTLKLRWHKLTHWEYWPLWAIYYPLFPIWVFFSIKARSFFFFNAANPKMKNGGMAMESKNEIYDMIPEAHIPKTILIEKDTPASEITKRINANGIAYPFIVKPDIGMKAFGVDKIHNREELQDYIDRTPQDYLIQEFIPYANEVGIFYVRMPNEDRGKITGIVAKEFLSVIGDGKSTILQLIKQTPRSHMHLRTLSKKFGNQLNAVLEKNKEFILVPFGSHTRGAKFIDKTNKNNAHLERLIDAICIQMPEFYYGRLDVLYTDFEELSEGKNFKIIEINGAGGEATHIYDPKHSLFFAWKEITRHWNYLCKISMLNHKRGFPYLSFNDGRTMLKQNGVLEEELKLV
ncbi:D-alanine--D-alanine ligase [Croceitalea rosinachiae]|uniref:D-alanine--D-alanine ligase n=1 Tax=Croceitalea rosinachiae TaxID=3075596 RepID=A0ABU3A5J5_9FLAO|nr:D-alanine--D-alanine ligase [Croceitalea sp. F388]MDT0605437.1 D-alanine--D-alanine ligase [Croceitalea sp. F388]